MDGSTYCGKSRYHVVNQLLIYFFDLFLDKLKLIKKMSISNFDATVVSSVSAYAFSVIALTNDEQLISTISGVSAIILCLTAIIKFVDLIFDKWKKWTGTED